MTTKSLVPASVANPESQAFWQAAQEGRFLLPVCDDCGGTHWYPRMICPFCSSSRIRWQEASGYGRLYSYSILRRAVQPYVLAYVTLNEGPSMLTNIIDCDFEQLCIGQRLKVVFAQAENGQAIPMFTPCGEPQPAGMAAA